MSTIDLSAIAKTIDQEFRTHSALLERDQPWFGAFELDKQNKRTLYKVGEARDPERFVLDWRHPLAAVYYEGAPGEVFDFEAPHFHSFRAVTSYIARVKSGRRSIARLEVQLADGAHTLVAGPRGLAPEGAHDGPRAPAGVLPDVRGLLSPEQYQLVTSSRGRPLVVQGRAGSGKTTVALYRLSWLCFASDERDAPPPLDPSKVLVVMFNAALRLFVKSSLAPLGLERVQLATFHQWALEAAKRAYAGALEVDAEAFKLDDAPLATSLKKRLGMLRALEAFVEQQTLAAAAWLEGRLQPLAAVELAREFRASDEPVARRFVALKRLARRRRDEGAGGERARWEDVLKVLQQGSERIAKYKEDLLKFLSSTALLRAHLPEASDDELARLARFQSALQRRDGSERRPGPHVSFDDLALLLRLLQLKHGGLPNHEDEDEVLLFDHLLVDEAQDFGALELRVLLAAARSRTGVTIVGDHNQKIVQSADFIGWEALASELGVDGLEVARLTVAHRSTEPIMRVARTLEEAASPGVRAAEVPGDGAAAGRDGPVPRLVELRTEAALREAVLETLRACLRDAPLGHHCVVTARRRSASLLYEALRGALGLPEERVRLGHNKDFRFEPGVTFTNVQQVKGLEFDSVLLLEPSEAHYPSDAAGRRLLYTALTRAKEQLHLFATQPTTTLLAAAKERGLLWQVRDGGVGARVQFSDEEDAPF